MEDRMKMIFRAYAGKSGIIINIYNPKKDRGGHVFKVNHWFKTKDLHPLAKDLNTIRDYVNSDHLDIFDGIIIIIELTDKMKEILKVYSDWSLFNLLMTDYLKSNEAFEYIVPKLMEELDLRINGK